MHFEFTPRGVCSRKMAVDIDDGIITGLEITGGCNGNSKGIGALVRGMRVTDVIERLDGISCGGRGTSCPDQLAKALKEYLVKNA